MPKFLLSYHGELADFSGTEAELATEAAAWETYYGSIGADLVDPGNPIASHTAVGPDGKPTDAPHAGLTGFTVVNVADVEAAMAIAARCPVLAWGSSVQVSALIEM